MRVIGCKTVSKEIDELESGQVPRAETQAHLQACGACRTFYDDRQKLREMIAGLETVAAPGDFDFRLRARLANQRAKRVSALSGFGFGLPSIALAVLALVIGVGIYMRATSDSRIKEPLAQSDAPKMAEPVGVPVAVPSANPDHVNTIAFSAARSRKSALISSNGIQSGTKERVRSHKGSKNSNSNTVRRDDLLAQSESSAMFPLEAAEPLRVSVDYATGGSRTISLPAVSFGSQQVVARGASMMKTSARTVW